MAAPYHALTVAASGDVHHDGTHSYFSGSAMKFDGTGDKLVVADGGSLDLVYGTGDFCVEFWVMHEGASWGNEGIFCNEDGTDNNSETMRISSVGSGTVSYIQYRLVDQGASTNEINLWSDASAGYDALLERCWYHVACVRVNGQAQLWQDGVLKDWATSAHNHTNLATEGIKIGLQRTDHYFSGWLDEIRMSIGTSRYTKSIERLANTFVTKGDTGDAYTVLQVQSRGVRNGTTYNDDLNRTGTSTTDASVGGNPVWITAGGDPLGGSNTALYFNGVDDYIDFKDSSDFEPGTGQFTVEYWMKPSIADEFKTVWTKGGTGYSVDYGGFQNAMHASPARMAFQHKIPTTGSGTLGGDNHIHSIQHTESGVAVNKWSHHIIQRSVDTHSYFIDGVLMSSNSSSAALTDNLTAGSYPLRMGISHDSSAASYFRGYIADFRFSKGIARYGGISLANTQQVVTSSNSDTQVVTSNSTFGSGTNLFTADAYTALLLQGDGTGFAGTASDTFTDESASPGLGAKTVTNVGGVKLRQGVAAFGANSYYFDGTNGYALSVPASADFSMDGDFTFEMWAKAHRDIASQTDIMISYYNYGASPQTGYQINAFANGSCGFYHGDASEGWGSILNPNSSFKDGEWHHLAIQRKDDMFGLYIDGQGYQRYKNYGTIGRSSTDTLYIGNNGGLSEAWHGWMDGIRLSKGIARYGYSGTNTKLGLNAVHPSHCKLLITSNTHHKNDKDFYEISDQGNYWNQTPYSYYWDGSNDTITLPNKNYHTGSNINAGVMTYAFWMKIPEGYTSNDKFVFGSSQGGTTNGVYCRYYKSSGTPHVDITIDNASNRPFDAIQINQTTNDGEWHLYIWTWDGTTNSNAGKWYLDGIVNTTGTASVADLSLIHI